MMLHWHLLILQRAPAFFWTQHILAPSALNQLCHPPVTVTCHCLPSCCSHRWRRGCSAFCSLFYFCKDTHTHTHTHTHNIQCFAGTANVNEHRWKSRYWFPKVPAVSKHTPHNRNRSGMHHCEVLLDSTDESEQQRPGLGNVSALLKSRWISYILFVFDIFDILHDPLVGQHILFFLFSFPPIRET